MESPVVILGGGYAGLGAAEELGRAGVRSTLLEAAPRLGGLAACVQVGPVLVEGAYHHIKPHETALISLIAEHGLADRLRWVDTRMGFHTAGTTYPFSTPGDLARFKPFSWPDKLRFALGVLRTKYSPSEVADGQSAREWILRHWGQRIHDRMLGPMLQNKFGLPSDEISAAFLHGRIRGIARTKSNTGSGERMGYLAGSLQPLTERWAERLRAHTAIHVNAPVLAVDREGDGFRVRSRAGEFRARHLINTLPLEIFAQLPKNFPFRSEVGYQSAVCGVFVIREQPTPLYWINVIDDAIPFKVLVNQSCLDDYPGTVLYCGNYLRAEDELYRRTDDEILARYEEGLRRLFGPVSVEARQVYRARYATPIFDRDFSRRTAELDHCVPGLVFAGNVKVYPHGRTLNNVLETGRAAARTILAGGAGRA